jgi:urease accessory protein
MSQRKLARFFALGALALPALAFAHAGHGNDAGFATGFEHPFEATDHLCALIAVGLLAGRLGGRAASMLVGVVLTLMALGLGAGHLGMQLPRVGGFTMIVIAVSAVLILAPPRRMIGAIVALAAAFAFFSGMAHGEWIIPGAEGWAFTSGFLLASAALIGGGTVAATLWQRRVTARAPRSGT